MIGNLKTFWELNKAYGQLHLRQAGSHIVSSCPCCLCPNTKLRHALGHVWFLSLNFSDLNFNYFQTH